MRRSVLAILALLIATPVYAQFAIPGADTALSLSLSPTYPAPNSTVTISLSSPLYDLDSSQITWSANGRPVKSGIGVTEISLVTGAAGEETDVSVDVIGASGSAHAEASIIPATIDLLWEASSYTPPLFRGRALPSAGTSVTLVALPHFSKNGKTVNPSDLTYTWKKDGEVIGKISGRGKSSATIDAPTLFGASTISVVAALADGSISGSASVRLSDSASRLYLYADHPLFGVLYNQAFGPNTFVSDTEMTFTASPLFSPVKTVRDPNLQYTWSVNQTEVAAAADNPNEITINAAKSTGLAQIQLSLTHQNNYFFSADATWNVTFTTSAASSVSADPFRAQ